MWTSSLSAVRRLFLANTAIVIALPLLGLVEWTVDMALVVVGLYFVFDCLGIVLTFHRYHAHRGFEFRWRWMEILFTVFGMLSASGSALGWTAIHHSHHKYSDTEKDPHSPRRGLWRVLSIDYPYERNKWGVRSIVNKKYHLLFHAYYFLILAFYAGGLYLAAGVEGVYFGFCAPSVTILVAQGFTNFINHTKRFGYTNFETADDSKNIWWMAPLNFGEGWHNNHHAHPENYTTKHRWWEVDIAGSIIGLIKA